MNLNSYGENLRWKRPAIKILPPKSNQRIPIIFYFCLNWKNIVDFPQKFYLSFFVENFIMWRFQNSIVKFPRQPEFNDFRNPFCPSIAGYIRLYIVKLTFFGKFYFDSKHYRGLISQNSHCQTKLSIRFHFFNIKKPLRNFNEEFPEVWTALDLSAAIKQRFVSAFSFLPWCF